jgi:hypothetical protein
MNSLAKSSATALMAARDHPYLQFALVFYEVLAHHTPPLFQLSREGCQQLLGNIDAAASDDGLERLLMD